MSLNTKDQLNMVIKTFKKLLSFKADKTELATKIDRSEFEEEVSKHLVNSDWNAPEGEPGHIKNRTHYEYIDTTVLFDQDIILQPAMEEAQYYFKEPLPLVKGKLYTVSFESKEYGVSNIVDVLCDDNGFLRLFDATNIDISISSNVIGWYHGPQNAHFKIEEKEHIVKKIDEKFIPDSIKNVQADWEQNDESSSDYIKNRPFYTKEENGIISYYNESGNLCAILEEGKVYTVTINGTSYPNLTCYRYYWYEQGGKDHFILGTSNPTQISTWPYDFLLYQREDNKEGLLLALCKEGSDFDFVEYSHNYAYGRPLKESDNVDITTMISTTKQIDEKFIPSHFATKEYVDESISNIDISTKELISIDDIDAICGGTIVSASEVTF